MGISIFGLIPAAGKSERMGVPKLSLPLWGATVLEHVIAAVKAGGVEVVVVVTRAELAEVVRLAAGASVALLPYETPDMRATVLHGLDWLEAEHHPQPNDGVLLLPADHPTLDPAVVRRLIFEAESRESESIFVPSYLGKRGHPTLFRWRHVEGLRNVSAGAGLNRYFRGQPCVEVAWESEAILWDLDTPADYEHLCRGARF